MDLRILTESKIKTKLRFLSNFGRKRYTEMGRYDFNITKNIMKLRLNMIEVKCNYKGQNNGEVCGLCGVERDTTEHLFECEVIKNKVGRTPGVGVLRRDDEDSYRELAEFLGVVLDIKGINGKKRVRENLRKDEYYIIKRSKNGMRVTVHVPPRKDEYHITKKSEDGMRITVHIPPK